MKSLFWAGSRGGTGHMCGRKGTMPPASQDAGQRQYSCGLGWEAIYFKTSCKFLWLSLSPCMLVAPCHLLMLFTIYFNEGKVIELINLSFVSWGLCVRKKGEKLWLLLCSYPLGKKTNKASSGTFEACLALINTEKSCQSITDKALKLPSFVFHPDGFLELNPATSCSANLWAEIQHWQPSKAWWVVEKITVEEKDSSEKCAGM